MNRKWFALPMRGVSVILSVVFITALAVGVTGCGLLSEKSYQVTILVEDKDTRTTHRVNRRTTTRTTYEVDAVVLSEGQQKEKFRVSAHSVYNALAEGREYTVRVTGDPGDRRTIKGVISTR